ncbi:hypothetical protein BDV98DRAFT_620345 [Pterulicium gracile]|uniref:Uncharacterized protein n=1 Tax=Pterulicium gracile TaxID=1884261 RepID=A0A5C3QHE7_9AGAR|nr:hypothetical protein BDV98DRAFT_620345 [Pterula gracilis]
MVYFKWDPSQPDPTWLEPSAVLIVYCHFIRISIHRPFISINDVSDGPLPMLILTIAARGLCQVMHCLKERGIVPSVYFHGMGFTAGFIILLLLGFCAASQAMGALELAEESGAQEENTDMLNQLRWIPVDEMRLDIMYPPTTSGQTPGYATGDPHTTAHALGPISLAQGSSAVTQASQSLTQSYLHPAFVDDLPQQGFPNYSTIVPMMMNGASGNTVYVLVSCVHALAKWTSCRFNRLMDAFYGGRYE